MPMLTVTTAEGAIAADAIEDLTQALIASLLHWEGAPDTPFFRAQAWCVVHEVPGSRFRNGADDLPRFRVDVTVPEGALSDERRAGLVRDVTGHVLGAAGLEKADAGRVWVLVQEQAEGTWGAGGHVIRFSDLRKLAAASASGASGADA